MQNEKNKYVVIVIPVYKEMDSFEIISLQQILRVLGRYDICLVAPESMDITAYMKYHHFFIKRFDDSYFVNVDSYSELLLNMNFYRVFSDYEYMLIYQLDGFVFSDRLQEFCDLSYDYIGAPIPYIGWPKMPSLIGNGGVSLRKIAKCIALLSHIDRKEIQRKLPLRTSAEDVIFSWCAADPQYDFTAAPYEVAQMFVVDYDTHHFYRKVKKDLPFANHAWAKTDYYFWRPIIESFGYTVPQVDSKYSIPMKIQWVARYLMGRMKRIYDGFERKKEVMQRLFPLESYVIWGYGIVGRRCGKFLSSYGISIERILDQSVITEKMDSGHTLEYPTDEKIMASRGKIIITPLNYEEEIASLLTEKGYKINKDFFKWSDLSYQIAKTYFDYFFVRTFHRGDLRE
ncbi:DUF5672 family protein [Selenomonas montiformis]|uniref:DUF5672 family protein n=1 Tax=Selenomonas montiformis TaxID=2652285 RepID=UPI0039F5FDC9